MIGKQYTIPRFFDPSKAREIWQVPYADRAAAAIAWRDEHDVPQAGADRRKVALMLVDEQNTFCVPAGELYVLGAEEDTVRVAEFIYRELGTITKIFATMDTHTVMQIFHPYFWVDPEGNHPEPVISQITSKSIEEGEWRVNKAVAVSVLGGNYAVAQRYALHYVRSLEQNGRYALTIWPYHAMLGGVGHALVPTIEEALFFHTIARGSQMKHEIKGGNPLTENYSIFAPDVLSGPSGEVIAQRNTGFLKAMMEFDVVIIAGQAKSHCVAWTIADLLDDIGQQDPALAKKVYLLEDGTSPVHVPGVVDYTDEANAAFARFADAGMHVVRTDQAISSWPGIS